MVYSEQKRLIIELNQGKELTEQLKNHMDNPLQSQELCESLVEKIISIYDKALSMLNWGELVGDHHQVAPPNLQPLADGSPISEAEASDLGLADQFFKDVYKKRKMSQRWTEQIRISSGTGQGHLEDGYSWRKYGQKDILGAKHPRAYYRCTHRHAQGCLATKLVQRADEESSIVEVTYKGRHTCVQASQPRNGSGNTKHHHKPRWEDDQNGTQSNEDLGNSPSVKTEDTSFPSFSFLPTPIEPETTEDNSFPNMETYLSLLLQEEDYCGLSQNLQHSESDLTDILSAPTSVSNSPVGDFGFSLDQDDIDPNFSFDTSEFFA